MKLPIHALGLHGIPVIIGVLNTGAAEESIVTNVEEEQPLLSVTITV